MDSAEFAIAWLSAATAKGSFSIEAVTRSRPNSAGRDAVSAFDGAIGHEYTRAHPPAARERGVLLRDGEL